MLASAAQGAPQSAPALTVTIPGPGVFDEAYPAHITLYLTAATGAPRWRWL